MQVRDVSENPLAKPAHASMLSDDPQMETRILENSINKICSLLAVGFGDAGAEVIANNIRSTPPVWPNLALSPLHLPLTALTTVHI